MYNLCMKKVLFILSFLMLSLADENQISSNDTPYLQQHKNDPVHWYSNYKDALKQAKEEDKPLFVSLGYSTCHWCHKMHTESFLNSEVAKQLNQNFISLKVDKESSPHLDQKYQNIFFKAKGVRGGWPLNIFLTPQGEVFYITNYIPRYSQDSVLGFDELLPYLVRVYNDKKRLQQQILKLKKRQKLHKQKIVYRPEYIVKQIESEMDEFEGGFGDAPKFPQSTKLQLILALQKIQRNEELEAFTLMTLGAMYHSGFYDHIDGGFFRYSVDSSWDIPHFEKMLYTQALMVELYTTYYQHYHKEEYRDVVSKTVDFVMNTLMHKNLFYSAVDADLEEQEGGYYLYSSQDLNQRIKSVEAEGHLRHITDTVQEKYKQYLKKLRAKKNSPFIDKKINTAWNSMMIAALFEASKTNPLYLQQAQKSLEALRATMFHNSQLYHQVVLPNAPKQKAFLEDYAFLIDALLRGYQQTNDDKYLAFANYLMRYALYHFYKNGLWYLDEQHSVEADLNDKYYPSPLSVMVHNLYLLDGVSLKSYEYKKIADQTMRSLKSKQIYPEESPYYLKNIVDFKLK